MLFKSQYNFRHGTSACLLLIFVWCIMRRPSGCIANCFVTSGTECSANPYTLINVLKWTNQAHRGATPDSRMTPGTHWITSLGLKLVPVPAQHSSYLRELRSNKGPSLIPGLGTDLIMSAEPSCTLLAVNLVMLSWVFNVQFISCSASSYIYLSSSVSWANLKTYDIYLSYLDSVGVFLNYPAWFSLSSSLAMNYKAPNSSPSLVIIVEALVMQDALGDPFSYEDSLTFCILPDILSTFLTFNYRH